VNPKLLELLALFQMQLALGLEIAQKQALNYRTDAGYELSKHRRDDHRAYWDHAVAAEHQLQNQDALRALREKYGANQKKIDELIEELSTANV